jgi:hypothetical protein
MFTQRRSIRNDDGFRPRDLKIIEAVSLMIPLCTNICEGQKKAGVWTMATPGALLKKERVLLIAAMLNGD